MHCILITGIPASGKSTLAKALSDRLHIPMLSKDAIKEIQDALNYIQEHITESPQVTITYFVADGRKRGGRYVTETVKIKYVDNLEQNIRFDNSVCVKFENIFDIKLM